MPADTSRVKANDDDNTIDSRPRWETRRTHTAGAYVLVRDGVEVGTISLLDQIKDHPARLSAVCSALARVDYQQADEDCRRAEAMRDSAWQRLGWQSKAEHDAAFAQLQALAAQQSDEVRVYLRDLWRVQKLTLPLSVDELDEWRKAMLTVCQPATVGDDPTRAA